MLVDLANNSKWRNSRPPKQDFISEPIESQKNPTKRKRPHQNIGKKHGSFFPSPSHISNTLEVVHSMNKRNGEDMISPMKGTPKGELKKGKNRYGQSQSKAQLEKLKHSMKDLVGSHIGNYQKFDTFEEFSMKVMHSTTTTLYFL